MVLPPWLLTQAHLEQWLTSWMWCYWLDIVAAAHSLMEWLYSSLRGHFVIGICLLREVCGLQGSSSKIHWVFSVRARDGDHLVNGDFGNVYMARSELCEAFYGHHLVSLQVPTFSLRGANGWWWPSLMLSYDSADSDSAVCASAFVCRCVHVFACSFFGVPSTCSYTSLCLTLCFLFVSFFC